MKRGFMLIELMIATLVASMVAGILLTALAQGTRFQVMVDNMIDVSLRVGVVNNQLEKDLMGAFVPVQAEKRDAPVKQEKEPAAQKDGEKKAEPAKNEKEDADKKGAEKKEQLKPIDKIFYSTNKEGNLDTLSFVTNNPMIVFVGKDVGTVKPNVVRVQYSLKPDNVKLEPDKKKSYTLYRQESIELDLAQYKNVKEYEVIGGIKSFVMTFTARLEKKPEENKAPAGQAQQEQKKSYEYKTVSEWVSEPKKEQKQEDSKEPPFPRIPYSIEVKMILWDKQEKKEKEFTFMYEIPVEFSPVKQEQPKKEPEVPKKDNAAGADGKQKQGPIKVARNAGGDNQTTVNIVDKLTQTLESLTHLFTQM